jgi:hypothetical protein
MSILRIKFKNLIKGWGKIPVALTLIAALLMVTILIATAAEYVVPPDEEVNGAWFIWFSPDAATGTGLFNPFVNVKTNKTIVQGYNTDYRPLQFDEESPWTDSIPLSDVPYFLYEGVLYREFQLDINQTNANPEISLDEVQIWLGGLDAKNITGFVPGATITDFGTFPGFNLQEVYNLDKGGDNHIKLDASLSAGSGKRDLRLLVPDAFFEPYDEECAYLGTGCEQYMVFYTKFGINYPNNDGFEEWGVAIYNVAKGFKWNDLDADGIWDVGEPPLSGWMICAQEVAGGLDIGDPICQMTKADGSYTLPLPNADFRIYETCPAGWLQSYPAPTAGVCGSGVHSISVKNGQVVENLNFGNYMPVSVKACKLEDVDKNPTTTADRVPVPGWTVKLSKNGTVIDTKTTGVDGCYTWEGLPALLSPNYYDVHEVVPADWFAWTPTEVNCTAGVDGGACDVTFVNSKRVSVKACKLEDVDKDPATTADRVAVPNWTVKLTKNGVVQDTKTTGADGCYTWTNLEPLAPPNYYDVHEVVPADWFAWTPTEVNCTAGVNGGACDATFVNSKKVSVKACKLEDVDTNPATTADRIPVVGWTVKLTKDGVVQETKTTGADGCYTWTNLEPLVAPHYYDVHEEVPASWFAWTPTTVNCTAGVNGGACDATFVNSKRVNVKACKLEDVDTNPATSADRVPVAGWTVKLTKNGVVQDTKLTGEDGCYTWTNLEPLAPPNYYDVHEEVPTSWYAWTPTSVTCDPIASGGTCTATFVNSKKVNVKVCKLEDVDADPLTAADRIPVPGWTVKLTKNGEVQDTKLTGADGCYTWTNLDPLAPPNYYDGTEVVPDTWYAWTPTSINCEPIASGGTCTLTFVNSERVKVTACKKQDMDGDLLTTADQVVMPGWPVYLSIGGVRQTPGALTGVNGCYTWEKLVPGLVYDVEEDVLAGWISLTPIKWDFGKSVSGGEYSYTFINYKPLGCTYTFGYWKTHSMYGPAGPYDPTWDLKAGGDDPFLSLAWNTGFTWYSILQEPPKGGNAYLILSYQYVAAWLNINNVDPLLASDPSVLGTAMADAEALLGAYTPYDILTPAVREQFITLASFLNEYNEGLLGPPHCE